MTARVVFVDGVVARPTGWAGNDPISEARLRALLNGRATAPMLAVPNSRALPVSPIGGLHSETPNNRSSSTLIRFFPNAAQKRRIGPKSASNREITGL